MSVFWTSELIALTNALSNPWPADPNPFVPKNAATISDPRIHPNTMKTPGWFWIWSFNNGFQKPHKSHNLKGIHLGNVSIRQLVAWICALKQKQHVEVIISQCWFLKIKSWPNHRFSDYILIILVIIINYQLSYLYVPSQSVSTPNSEIRLLLLLLATNHVDHDHPKDGGGW